MDDIEAEQQRDAETVARQRQPLESVDLGRIGQEQQRSCLAAPERLLDLAGLGVQVQSEGGFGGGRCRQAEVEVLRQLPGLLGRCHLAHQLVDSCPDRGRVIAAADLSPGLLVWLGHSITPCFTQKSEPSHIDAFSSRVSSASSGEAVE